MGGTVTIHIPFDCTPTFDVAFDPLGTVHTSLVELFGALRPRVPRSVVAEARRLASNVDMSALMCTSQFSSTPWVEEFLWPEFPDPSATSLADQLERISDTPSNLMIDEMTATDRPVLIKQQRVWLDAPEVTLRRYVAALRCYAREVLEKLYPKFERRLYGECRYMKDVLHRGGVAAGLIEMHSDVRLDNGMMQFATFTDRAVVRSAQSVLITPMICSPQTVSHNGLHNPGGDMQMIGFANSALAVTGLAPRTPSSPDPLATLLGDTRAAILRALFVPSTTTALANELGYSPSTISHHLKALSNAQAIDSHRTQWFMNYRLTDIGRQLIALYR
ncbi:Helix-turn-helix domain-containing protein [Frankineae bacterium MT45]|nr:Helix-turn-helix domain-containing protein [Frankineae bacterium MT45]